MNDGLDEIAATVAALAGTLPAADLRTLAAALLSGESALAGLRARSGSDAIRAACVRLSGLLARGVDAGTVAGALVGAAAAAAATRAETVIDVVWTGPTSEVTTSRLTSEVVAELIGSARREVLLIGFATHDEPHVAAALRDAANRGVDITLLLERADDNPTYRGPSMPFAGIALTRLAWRRELRPIGAALHAKVLAIDKAAALVGSANITGRALETNLECGILIKGGRQPAAIFDHVESLRIHGILTSLPGSRPS